MHFWWYYVGHILNKKIFSYSHISSSSSTLICFVFGLCCLHGIKFYYRPRTKYEGRYCFHRCLSVHISGGIPHPRSRWGGGYPISGLDGGFPIQDWMGYPPPIQCWTGTPPPPSRRQSSIASTCYAAGGMPLAFTQEDFLVFSICFMYC